MGGHRHWPTGPRPKNGTATDCVQMLDNSFSVVVVSQKICSQLVDTLVDIRNLRLRNV